MHGEIQATTFYRYVSLLVLNYREQVPLPAHNHLTNLYRKYEH